MYLFTPNHVQLLNSCYPPSALLTAGAEYSPNSQELSRLTYYASNHPGKLTKLGTELEKRLKNEARKARTGNIRTRASLLITLSIFRALATECRRDIALFSASLVSSIDATLAAVPTDLEVAARAASVFTAWTTFTDGHLIGTDSSLTGDYQSVLRHFAELSCSSATDHEVRNRTRLIGFAALTGALNSEALYNDSAQFKSQVSTIMRPILTTLFETEVDTLNEQAAAAKGASSSPYLAEFRTRPAMERRAASIHVHIDGDKGPSMVEVSNASLRALISLAGHANSPQIGFIMHSLVDNIEEARAWGNLHHCCWLAQKMVEWSQYQYRYAVPTWLVERLCRSQETSSSPTHYRVLAEMATTVFRSPNPLVNLSTSDIASNLTTLLLRRTESDPEDPLVPALIECIASLGRHVYYSDQIQDLAGELINRIVIVEVQGALSRGKTGSAKSRTQAVRSLLAALLGLIQAAAKEDPGASSHSGHGPPSTPAEIFKQEIAANGRVSRRTTVPPDIWQDTLSLLCDDDYMVRADYSDALIFYLSEEMTKHGDTADGKRLSEGPLSQAVKINLLLHAGNHGTKLLHAIHAYLYILATSSTLGLTSSSSTSSSHSTHEGSPNVNVNVFPPIPNKDDDNEGPESTLSQYGRPSTSAPQSPRARKVTVVQRLLDQTPPGLSTSTSARLTDYTLILDILTTVHEELPVRGLLTGIPMLIALDDVVSNAQNPEDPATIQRIDAIRELIAKVWLALGGVWNSPELVKLAESALASGPGSLPTVERTNLVAHLPPRHAVEFPQDRTANTPWSGVNVQTALALLTASPGVHEATGLDRETLMRRLSTKWTAEIALRDSIERSSSFENTVRADGLAPLLKISPALMHIENISQASLACSTRGVGVADLRGALEGRSSMSNPALGRPASISTLEHAPSTLEGGHLKLTQTRSRPQSRSKKRSTPNGTGEVRDVLNRLGIGKQNGSLLKASFPALQKSDQRAPPYKS